MEVFETCLEECGHEDGTCAWADKCFIPCIPEDTDDDDIICEDEEEDNYMCHCGIEEDICEEKEDVGVKYCNERHTVVICPRRILMMFFFLLSTMDSHVLSLSTLCRRCSDALRKWWIWMS